jgi:DNA-nicking Smr family endonuclease
MPAKHGRAARVTPVQVGQPPAGLDRSRWRDLNRGRTRPERTLDLHGRRAQDAYHAVRAFLHAAQADGLRCVAVVTGKGPMPEGGVLRREFPHWLNAPDLRHLVLGAAYPHAANQGAVHLLLRRRRGP